MKIYVFGDKVVSLMMDTESREMKFLSFAEQECVERRNTEERQHILRLRDRDVAMIGQACRNKGYVAV